MTSGVEIDAERIATAVTAAPHIAGLDSGRFGEIATYLPGKRVAGVRIRPDEITVGVVGSYPATIAQIGAAVRAAVGDIGRPIHVRVQDIAEPTSLGPVTNGDSKDGPRAGSGLPSH